jgi:hypothetical protein
LLAVLYPVDIVAFVLVAASFGRAWRNRWLAGLATGVSMLPFFALISLAADHDGPTSPYGIDWIGVLVCSSLIAAVILAFHTPMVQRLEVAQERARRRRQAVA